MYAGVLGEVLDVLRVRATSEHDVKQVCLRSCHLMSGNSERLSRGLKNLLIMFCASRGVPLPVANTSPDPS